MPFDKSLDKEIFKEEIEFEMTKITVSVFSYNGGTPKLQIGRQNRNQDSGDWVFSKLGRLVKEEAERIAPAMQKALEHM
jgi:formate-dependent phosphoribosylglycinamide formyltransferase (GAR transformylase)